MQMVSHARTPPAHHVLSSIQTVSSFAVLLPLYGKIRISRESSEEWARIIQALALLPCTQRVA